MSEPERTVDELEGRALDAAVAEEVFGFRTHRGGMDSLWMELEGGNQMAPHYSTSIEAAWEVVEALRSNGWHVRIVSQPGFYVAEAVGHGEHITVDAETAPYAICRAALKAVRQHGGAGD